MKIATISSFDDYLKYTESYKGKYYFRGQADASWSVTPSLFRNGNNPSLETERGTIRKELTDDQRLTPLTALFRAQHFGIPTRICDLTIGHLCALFFAAEGETDGAVYIFTKDQANRLASLEMMLFSHVLSNNISRLSEVEGFEQIDIAEALSQNYIVEYRDLVYSNSRAFRQGGTGILFGLSCKNDEISPIGNNGIDDLIVEKIIIPVSVKSEIIHSLRQLGYSKEILHGDSENAVFDNITLNRTEFIVNKRADKNGVFNKITAKYRVNSLYFNRDKLALDISRLYKGLFLQYGSNARIWTYFYFDDNDVTHANWICMGLWRADTQFKIQWTKGYKDNRLNYMNTQISRAEAISRFAALAEEISPIYDKIYRYTQKAEYNIAGFFALVEKAKSDVMRIANKANEIPYSDVETEKITGLAWMYINDIDWLVGDMTIFSKRDNVKEKTVKWMLEHTYLKKCEDSKRDYLQAMTEENGDRP